MQNLVRPPRQPLSLDPRLDPPDLANRGLIQALRRPAKRIDDVEEPTAEPVVPGDRLGPQQGLRLPEGRPAAVVLGVGGEGADQRTLPTLGTKVGIDEQRRIGRRNLKEAAKLVWNRGRPVGWVAAGLRRRGAGRCAG